MKVFLLSLLPVKGIHDESLSLTPLWTTSNSGQGSRHLRVTGSAHRTQSLSCKKFAMRAYKSLHSCSKGEPVKVKLLSSAVLLRSKSTGSHVATKNGVLSGRVVPSCAGYEYHTLFLGTGAIYNTRFLYGTTAQIVNPCYGNSFYKFDFQRSIQNM